jgi:hypothetical protein
MRFLSRNAGAKYIVRAGYYEYVGQHKILRPGVAAKFTAGMFDSEIEAKKNGWDADLRQEVENHLLNHPDYGITMYVPGETDVAETAPSGCKFGVPSESGFSPCGAKTTEDSWYCVRHDALVRASETNESPNAPPEPKAKGKGRSKAEVA